MLEPAIVEADPALIVEIGELARLLSQLNGKLELE